MGYIRHLSSKQQLACLMLIALILRLILIVHHPFVVFDDAQYFLDTAGILLGHLSNLDFESFFNTRVRGHWGAAIMGLFPQLIALLGLPLEKTYAVFFALPAIVNIWLVYQIAMRMAYPQKTALIAAFLYTFSFSAIYMTVHSTCYEMAMMFVFLAFVVLLDVHKPNAFRLLLCGFLFWWAFMVYYGYWVIILWGLITATFYKAFNGLNVSSFFSVLRNGLITATGFFVPFATIILLSSMFDYDFLAVIFAFSGKIKQGVFAEGASLPFYFLLYTELFWFFVAVIGTFVFLIKKQIPCRFYLLAGLFFVYSGLALFSTILEYTVVYGRLVKQLILPLCLIAAVLLTRLERRVYFSCLLLIVAGYFFNYVQLYNVVFGEDLIQQAKLFKQQKEAESEVKHEYKLLFACEVNEGICAVPENCELQKTLLVESVPHFFHYDGMLPEFRADIVRLNVRGAGFYQCAAVTSDG